MELILIALWFFTGYMSFGRWHFSRFNKDDYSMITRLTASAMGPFAYPVGFLIYKNCPDYRTNTGEMK